MGALQISMPVQMLHSGNSIVFYSLGPRAVRIARGKRSSLFALAVRRKMAQH
jgi:hypothetical protein